MSKDGITPEARQGRLALFASARLDQPAKRLARLCHGNVTPPTLNLRTSDTEHIYRRSNANRVPLDGNFRTVVGDYANFNAPRTFGVEGTLKF